MATGEAPVVPPPITPVEKRSAAINIFEGLMSQSEDDGSLRSRDSVLSTSSSFSMNRRFGRLILAEQSCSSEETGMETDTGEEIPLVQISAKEPSEPVSTLLRRGENLRHRHCFRMSRRGTRIT